MKKMLLTLLTVASTLSIHAQELSYAYDDAGNRVKREVVVQASKKSIGDYPTACYSEVLANQSVNITVNPAMGKLSIEIPHCGTTDKCRIYLFTASGQKVLSKDPASSHTEFDTSPLQNGIYVLRISLNGKETTWKIIKK